MRLPAHAVPMCALPGAFIATAGREGTALAVAPGWAGSERNATAMPAVPA
ncbi:hypothetical protein DSC_00200 [Pseudoxanthomonas spadix BD-a59]|uniref:Uncharacterized protein n=1 Tax=Pseudoxanthomonas spadix (strain BD-a59) TaxID=1045855 RepID=G7URL8_PSEUP|nr:hypothetical protein DSC_00200 [Pseudoxanthomonas spadix BD-a59]